MMNIMLGSSGSHGQPHPYCELRRLTLEFRISDTFTDSLTRLTGEEQKAVKTSVYDFQVDPKNPGLSFHKLDKAKDKNFWSVRVSSDIRIIVHRTEQSVLLCYVDHHDKAYAWAERRKLEVHPKTGAAQLVEIRETVKEIVVPTYVPQSMPANRPAPPIFTHLSEERLLDVGVPQEWLADVKNATEDSLLLLAEHLPAEAAEALLELATGGIVEKSVALRANLEIVPDVDLLPSFDRLPPRIPTPAAFEHPDAQRRFRTIRNVEELQQALDFPWEKWTIFLHPAQREFVERDYSGPARVSGSAGTGKTIVALHRAVHLARRHADGRVLLATYTDTLANALKTKLTRLLAGEPRLGERIDVHSLESLGRRLHKAMIGPVTLASEREARQVIREAAAATPGHHFSQQFLVTEWEQIIDPWQLSSWEEYRDVARLGRKTRLKEAQRATLWAIFEKARNALQAKGLMTHAGTFTALGKALTAVGKSPYDFAVVDESQDIGVPHLRFFAALGGGRPNALFFAGDLGQRIFQQPFSWKSLGVDIRGRARTLRVNYRTSHQIRAQADRLLNAKMIDVDGNTEDRANTVSVFNGAPPEVIASENEAAEIDAVAGWIKRQVADGLLPHEIGVIVRSANELSRAEAALDGGGVPYKILDDHVVTLHGFASVSTMHLAKGLEFRAVAVMACDDEIIPSQARIETVGDDADLQEVYETERHLLYVACTRARDHLLITGVEPASEFLDDIGL